MRYTRARPGHDRARKADRHWPDALFRIALVVWLVFGMTSIIRKMLAGQPSLTNVLLVAWGVVVIVVLWFRLGPPRERSRIDLLR
jgi:hypothetical protein